MPDKDKEKKSEFTITDRRLFSTDGELRRDVVEAEERREEREQETREAQQRANQERSAERERAASSQNVITREPPQEAPIIGEAAQAPEAPSADEQKASADAYQDSTRQLDSQIRDELGRQGQAHRAQDFEMTFDKFIASLYMSALMQLGLAAPQGGQPQVDLLSARQTIDILGILQEKTKGNLTAAEQNMLQNILYELRMAYLEVTNMLAHPPEGSPAGANQKR